MVSDPRWSERSRHLLEMSTQTPNISNVNFYQNAGFAECLVSISSRIEHVIKMT